MAGLLTEHCLVVKHTRRLGVATRDYYRSCDDAEEKNLEHLLCFCIALDIKRLRTMERPVLCDFTDISGVFFFVRETIEITQRALVAYV